MCHVLCDTQLRSAIFRSAVFTSRFLGLPFSRLPFSTLCSFPVCQIQICHFQSPHANLNPSVDEGVADVSGKGGNYPVTARPITASDELLSLITREQNTRPLHRAASVCTAQSCPWVHFV